MDARPLEDPTDAPSRLRDEPPRDASARAGLDLLAAAKPVLPSDLERRRRWLAVAAKLQGQAIPPVALRPMRVAVFGALVLAATGAVAASGPGRALLHRMESAFVAPRAPARVLPPPPSEPVLVQPLPEEPPPAAAPSVVPRAPETKPAAVPRVRHGADPVPVPIAAEAPPKATASDEPSLVFGAMTALRRDHDAARAAAAALAYLARHPRGAFAEEALAIAREALTTSDPPRARALAREYLSRYPTGSYREAAKRMLEEPKSERR